MFGHYNSILATFAGKLTKQTRLSKLSILYADRKWKLDFTRPCYGLIIISLYMVCRVLFLWDKQGQQKHIEVQSVGFLSSAN